MSSRFFQDELAYLRDSGGEFGRAHPGLAASLAQRGIDPDVERLLEGFAFLTARIRERAEDCVPELAQELAEMLQPGYVRPLPAATVVNFEVQPEALRGRQILSAGTLVQSGPHADTACRFRTVQDCALLPLRLREAHLAAAGARRYRLALSFALPTHAAEVIFAPDGLRLFFGQAFARASNLWLAVLRHTVALEATSDEGRVALSTGDIRCPALGEEAALYPGFAAPHRLAQDYFNFAHKFLFVDIGGLERLRSWQVTYFTLTFTLEDCPPLALALPQDAVRLHCVPAVNLFAESAMPLRAGASGEEHLLRADGLEPAHQQVYAVPKVSALSAGSGARRDYPAFADFVHAAPGAPGHFHRLRRARSSVDGGIDTYLSLFSGPHDVLRGQREVVSVELLCTNRWLPTQLRLGDLSVLPQSGLPLRACNVTEISAPLSPPLGDEMYWQLLAQLALGHREVRSAADLRQLLAGCNLQRYAGHSGATANARRIAAVRGLEVGREQRLVRGVPVGGLRYRLAVDEAGFVSEGDAYIFGLVLDDAMAAALPINSFHALQLRLRPSLMGYRYSVRGLGSPHERKSFFHR